MNLERNWSVVASCSAAGHEHDALFTFLSEA